MASNDKTVYDPGATISESGRTVYEGDQTVPESAGTVPDGGTTLAEAALSDAAARGAAGAPAENAAIVKGETVLDTYTVESDAIEGGMGSVWRVHHKGWNVDLAMKRPQPKCFSTEESKATFIHECEAWINLGLHPNIVSCYYIREIAGIPSIFSEWMDGGSLESAINKGTLYTGTEAEQKERILDIAIQFARGLDYAHEQGLIHQDVKPDNLLLTKDGEAKVADFGLAKARAVLTVMEGAFSMNETSDSSQTIMSPSGGYTLAYCSMEQMDGKELTRRTDIYSWAVSLMEMYMGSRPWSNGVVAGLGCRGYFESACVPMPEALKELLSQCMDADPEKRPHDFAEIETKLHQIYKAETGNPYPRPVLKAAADTADSLNNRALSFLDLGKEEEAGALLDRAIKINAGDSSIIFNRSLHSWRSGKIDDVQLKHDISFALEDPSTAEALERECPAMEEPICFMSFDRLEDPSTAEAMERKYHAMEELDSSRPFGDDSDLKVYLKGYDISPDGRFVVFVPANRAPKVMDLSTHEIRFDLDVQDMSAFNGHAAFNVAFSPDGKRIYADCEVKGSRCFFIFDTETGIALQKRPYTCYNPTSSVFIRPSPDGSIVLCCQYHTIKTFLIRDAHTGEILAHPYLRDWKEPLLIHKFVLTPSGTHAIISSFSEAYCIDLKTWKIVTVYKATIDENANTCGHRENISALLLDSTGQQLLTGGRDGRICLWDVTSGKCKKVLFQTSNHINILRFCPGEKRFLSGGDGMIRFHDFPDGGHIFTRDFYQLDHINVHALLPTADAETMILIDNKVEFHFLKAPVAGEAMPMRLNHIANFKQTLSDEAEYHKAIAAAKTALNERRIDAALAAIEKAYCCTFRDIEELLSLNRSIGRFCRREKPRSSHMAKLLNLSSFYEYSFHVPVDIVIPDGSAYAYVTGSYSNSGVYKLDLITFEVAEYDKERTREHTMGLYASPNGRYMTVIADEYLGLYDLTIRDEATSFHGRISDSNASLVKIACCNSKGDILYVGAYSTDLDVTAYDILYRTRESAYHEGFTYRAELAIDSDDINPYKSIQCSPDSRFAYVIYHGEDEQCLQQYCLGEEGTAKKFCEGEFNCMALSYDGTLIAVAHNHHSKDKAYSDVNIFRSDDASVVCSYYIENAAVENLSFGSDGKTLYCAFNDGAIYIYDLSEAEPIWQFSRGETNEPLRSMAVTDDAHYVLIGEQTGNLRIFELDWQYSFPGFADWDEAARPCLEQFYRKYPGTEENMDALMRELQNRGFGYINKDGVRAKYAEIRAEIQLQELKTQEPQTQIKPKPEEPNKKKHGGLFGLFGKKKQEVSHGKQR